MSEETTTSRITSRKDPITGLTTIYKFKERKTKLMTRGLDGKQYLSTAWIVDRESVVSNVVTPGVAA